MVVVALEPVTKFMVAYVLFVLPLPTGFVAFVTLCTEDAPESYAPG